MKKLSMILAVVVLGLFSLMPRVHAETTCENVNAPTPETFEMNVAKRGTLMATFKWFENPEGTWTLKMDTDPRGGHETWVSDYPKNWSLLFTKPVELPQTVVENVCPLPVEEVQESTPSASNTFDKDTRCHGTTPPAVTWAMEKDNLLTWSAVGGDKVELRFGWMQGFYPFRVMLTNDGHEQVGLGTDIGYWFNHFEMRTVNGCKVGQWSYFN